MKKIIVIIITTFALVANVHAGSDGELVLKKNEPSEIKDCSETFNKASFALIKDWIRLFLNQFQVFTESCPLQ